MTTATMQALLARQGAPQQLVVEPIGGSGLGEVAHTVPAAHCHHRPGCLTPLGVGDLVAPGPDGWSLLEHLDVSP